MQTPATVFLDQTGIAYSVHSYEHDPAAPSFGLEAAARLELDPSAVFKTLMARLDDDRGPLVVAIVPVNCLLYTSPSPRDRQKSRMPSSA